MSRYAWGIACGVMAIVSSATAVMQTRFVDDARRDVQLPSRVSRVFAAGAPAEVLLYTLVPEMLVGRNRVPEGDAVEFFPPAYRTPVFIKQLPEVDNPSADAELLALKPDVYVDYGTVHEDYIASLNAVQQRTRVPGIILDGALTRIPETYRRLGAALGVAARGESSCGRGGPHPDEVPRCVVGDICGAARVSRVLRRRVRAVPRRRQRGRAAQMAGRCERCRHACNGAATPAHDRRDQGACSSSHRGDRWAGSRRTSARQSSVAVGRRGGGRSRVPVSGTSVQLGSAAAVGQSAARAHVARVRGVRARIRRGVRRRRSRLLQRVLPPGTDRSAVAETRRSMT